jgi:diazepam-binding inhibitor (GABA receptor modulator, acyl-CoA-binding protein)
MQEVDVPQDSLKKIYDLSTKFIAETKLPLSDELKLQLYSYYKQATVGDCKTDKPAIWEMVAKAKW